MKSFVIMSKDSNKSISEEALLLEARQLVDNFVSSLPKLIQASALFLKSTIPFRALSLREALLHRISSIAITAVELFEQKKNIPAIILTRSVVESFALFYAFYEELVRFIDIKNIGALDDFLKCSLVSARNDDELPSPKNILNWIDRIDKQIPEFRSNYDILCEYTHPNYSGTLGAFGDIDYKKLKIRLGLKQDIPARTVGISNLLASLLGFKIYYNETAGLMNQLDSYFEHSDSCNIDSDD